MSKHHFLRYHSNSPALTKACFHRSLFLKTLSIDALVDAVKDFRGGLLVVSHDQHFITHTCKELWVVGGGKVNRFRGDFNDYKKETLQRTAKRVADSVKSLSTINN